MLIPRYLQASSGPRAKLLSLVDVQSVGELFDVEAAGGGIYDVLVDSAFLVETVRIARLLDTSVLEGVDDVAVDDLGDAVRDHDDCPVTLYGVDAGLDLLGSNRVKAGCRLVEEDDRRVLEE